MNIRRRSEVLDFSTVPTTDPNAVPLPLGHEPGFHTVGRPWRYEFPRQPSSSDPATQPRFTVSFPGGGTELESATTPTPVFPLASDPADRK